MNPKIIQLQRKGNDVEGYLSIASSKSNVPFEIKRSFWTYLTPESVIRGKHAHYDTEMILIALCGQIDVTTINFKGKKDSFLLDNPNQGLFLPKLCWHEMKYQENAIQLVLCSTLYQESDYIRSLDVFKELIVKK